MAVLHWENPRVGGTAACHWRIDHGDRRHSDALRATCGMCWRTTGYRKRVMYLDPEARGAASVLLDWLVERMPRPAVHLDEHRPTTASGLPDARVNLHADPSVVRFLRALPEPQRAVASSLAAMRPGIGWGFPLRELIWNAAEDEIALIRKAERIEAAVGRAACVDAVARGTLADLRRASGVRRVRY